MIIQTVAELVSAYAAIVTVALAFAELVSRNKAKKADVAIEIYADFLYIMQQVDYATENVKSLCTQRTERTFAECQAFAKSHIMNPSLNKKIEHVETATITCFNNQTLKEKENLRKIMELIGKVINLVATINTVYNTIIIQSELGDEWFANSKQIVSEMHDDINLTKEECNTILRENLKDFKNSSPIYLTVLLVTFVIFFLICTIL